MKSLRIYKLFDWLIYLAGLLVITSAVHELYHYSFCGGEWVAGFGNIRGKSLFGGYTFCQHQSFEGEVVPTILEITLFLHGVLLKILKEE